MATRPPVVLIHGACSQPAHFAAWQAMFAEAGYDCRVPALPGHAPVARATLRSAGFSTYVTALRTVVADLDRPPVLVGHSMGALVARMVAAEHDVAGLVLLAPLPGGRVPVTRAALPYFAMLAPFVALGQPFRPWRSAIRRLALSGLPEDERDGIAAGFVPESGRAYRDLVLGRAKVRRRAIRAPMLVLHGEDDRLIPPAVARGIAGKHGAEERLLPGRGHWLLAPSLVPSVGRIARDWIDGLARGDASQLR
ncbi:MAG: alpha/beta fold hydrolase [Rhizobiales bacterium]|nr:alpha/beta fold hydrolase [Hyphomicrobiales bacterium]